MKESRKSKPDLENMAKEFYKAEIQIFNFKQYEFFMPLPFTQ